MLRPFLIAMLGVSAILALAAGVACDAEPADGAQAERTDVAGDGDASSEVSVDVGPEVAEVSSAPSPALEKIVSLAGEAGAARDDLFCDLSGDDLVWVQMWLDLSVSGAMAETDCATCPYCAGCRFDLMYRRLPAGPAELLYAASQARMGPGVGDGVATWVDDSGATWMRDLARGVTQAVPIGTYLNAPPIAHGGKLWWWGYDNSSGNYAFNAYDRVSGRVESGLLTYLQDPNAFTSSPLANLARRQPFTVSDDGIWFAQWDGTLAINLWPFEGAAETVLKDDSYSYMRVMPRVDGTVVTLGYDNASDCEGGTCQLGFTAFARDDLRVASGTGGSVGTGGVALAVDAVPTRYVAPAVDGARIVWLDHRDGPYTLYGVGPMGDEVRLTSDEAEIGAVSTIAASGGRVVWADRRTGHWRIMARDW